MSYRELVKDICDALDKEIQVVENKLCSNGITSLEAYRYANGQLNAWRAAKAIALKTLKRTDEETQEDEDELDNLPF